MSHNPIMDSRRIASETGHALAPAVEALTAAVWAWAERVTPALLDFARKVGAVTWDAYRDAGMPYGETHEGLLRWMRERQRAQQLHDEADRIDAIHDTCARLRQTSSGA